VNERSERTMCTAAFASAASERSERTMCTAALRASRPSAASGDARCGQRPHRSTVVMRWALPAQPFSCARAWSRRPLRRPRPRRCPPRAVGQHRVGVDVHLLSVAQVPGERDRWRLPRVAVVRELAHDCRSIPGGVERRRARRVDDDARRRAEYSADASNYRHVLRPWCSPATTDEVVATVADRGGPRGARHHARRRDQRGGQRHRRRVVVDCSRWLNRVVAIDPGNRVARVEPGVVLDQLRAAGRAVRLDLRARPLHPQPGHPRRDDRNNACGSHSPAWGRTVDHVRALTCCSPTGTG